MLSLQSGLLLTQGRRGGLGLFKAAAIVGLAATHRQQGFAQLQQPLPQGLSRIPLRHPPEAQPVPPLLQAAAGHGTAALQQIALEGDEALAAHGPAGLLQVGIDQGVAEDMAEDIAVDGLERQQINGTAEAAGGSGRGTAVEGTAAAATGPQAVEGQECEPAGPPALEQGDGAGGNAVVVDHHLAEPRACGHLQGHPETLLHFGQLGHGAVDPLQSGLEQQAQGTGTTAFLQHLATAVKAGDLALELLLLLLQARAGALLQGQGFGPFPHHLAGGLGGPLGLAPALFEPLTLLPRLPEALAFDLDFGGELGQAVVLLMAPFLGLHRFGAEWFKVGLELAQALAAALIIVEPGPGATRHLGQTAAAQVDSGGGGTGVGLRLGQGRVDGGGLKLLALLLQLLTGAALLTPFGLQGALILLQPVLAPMQLAVGTVKARQFTLRLQQLFFAEGTHLLLQLGKGGGGGLDRLTIPQQGFVELEATVIQLLQLFDQGLALAAPLLDPQQLLLQAALLQLAAEALVQAGPLGIAVEAGTGGVQFGLDDAAAFLTLLHLIELGAGLGDAPIKEGHPRQLVDDAAPLPGTHRHDAGDIALHDDVAAFGVDPQAPQLGLQLLGGAGLAFGEIGAAVGAPGGDTQPPGDRPLPLAGLDPGTFGGRFEALLGRVGCPVP